MSRVREGAVLFWVSVLAGLLLTVVAVPEGWRPFRPFWLGLLVIWWALESPERMGMGMAFVIGLMQDVLIGTLLGEHAFRLVAIVFILLRFRSRLRFFPMWQQALAVLAILFNDRIVTWAIRGLSGDTAIDWRFWMAPIVAALLWPWLFLLLDDLRRRSRPRES